MELRCDRSAFGAPRFHQIFIPATALLVTALAACGRGGQGPLGPGARFEIVYSATVAEVPGGARQVRLWVPVPVDLPEQDVESVRAHVEAGGRVFDLVDLGEESAATRTGADGPVHWTLAAVRGGIGRSLCVETEGSPVRLELRFVVTRRPARGGGSASEAELREALAPDRLIPVDGRIAEIAARIESGSDAMETARVLYEHTLQRMRYEKPPGQPWGRGDALWACDARYGNCSDFHSYFIALARAKGLPARFEMGLPVPAGDDPEVEIGGYHCWAYFWAGKRGWVPVDISEADKHPEKARFFFGNLDADRVTLSGGRDLELEPPPAQGPLNFFVYPYAEVDGEPCPVKRSFRRRLLR